MPMDRGADLKDPAPRFRSSRVSRDGIIVRSACSGLEPVCLSICTAGAFFGGAFECRPILAAIGDPKCRISAAGGGKLRQSILKAYQWSIARTPAVQLKDGVFVPASPSILYCFGPTGDIFPGEDGNRSWCYDVELAAITWFPQV
ncbi:MAG: hypothetical protein IPI28_18035 [Candidatus Omnitrophica bacterium]|nr:hypothetical protein [Candidatus Omnitrophota bacterium]